MIIQNGYIESVTLSEGGLDPQSGHPVPAEKEYGELIPCQFYASRLNMQAKSNGEAVTAATWTILVESIWDFRDVRTVRLQDMAGRMIGEFPVVSIEPLDAVGQIRITV